MYVYTMDRVSNLYVAAYLEWKKCHVYHRAFRFVETAKERNTTRAQAQG